MTPRLQCPESSRLARSATAIVAGIERDAPAAVDQRAPDGDCRGHFGLGETAAGQHDGNVTRHQFGGGGHVELASLDDADLHRGLRPDSDAVADVAHVYAMIGRRRAGIEKRELDIAVLGARAAERHPQRAVAPIAVEGDGNDSAVVHLHDEIALGVMGGEIVENEHEIVHRHAVLFGQRHVEFVVAAEIGKVQAVGEAEIGERDRINQPARLWRRRWRGSGFDGGSALHGRAAHDVRPRGRQTSGRMREQVRGGRHRRRRLRHQLERRSRVWFRLRVGLLLRIRLRRKQQESATEEMGNARTLAHGHALICGGEWETCSSRVATVRSVCSVFFRSEISSGVSARPAL